MNKGDNIREKVLATGNEQLANEHFPEDSHAPQPAISNQQPVTENMEVHKHPHHITHKKKWGEYFLEFLMIFFAVTLGFLAENLTEETDPALFNIGYSGNKVPEGSYVVPRHQGSFTSLYGNCVAIGILNRNIAQQYIEDAKQKAVNLMNVLTKEYHLPEKTAFKE